MSRYSQFVSEITFVIAILLLTKYGIFPFLFGQLTDGEETWRLLVWSQIVFGLLSCFVYFGLGSISRQVYTLTRREAIGCYLLLHLPLFLPFSLASDWKRLLTDAWALFLPHASLKMGLVILIYLLLFMGGRCCQMVEQTDEGLSFKKQKCKG
jgi:hypothetical protein